tara:strand:- start:85 stop:1140 length:1056 start_codon:yes stop_codon:yes gene_type:complete
VRVSLWRAILGADGPLPDEWQDAPPLDDAGRLGGLLTPALAAHFLRPVEARLGTALLDAAAVRQSLLFNRFNGGVQRRWMHEIAATGIPVAYLKGFAFAHSLYPVPDLRTIGDMDLLVREADLGRLLEFLTGRGFSFDALPLPPWGFISDASFMPLMSPEGDCNIDIHIQPDCYPAYRSLTADDVFGQSVSLEIDGTVVSIPSVEHAMILCLTNAAKDKFGIFSVRKLADIVMLLRSGHPIDWDRIAALAAAGRFLKPARTVFALLCALGLPPGAVPGPLCRPPAGLSRGPFRRLVSDHAEMFHDAPGPLRVLEREFTLCAEPDIAVRNAATRITGLFRRRRGLPAGFSAD